MNEFNNVPGVLLVEKAPKDIAFEEQVEWAIKRTKEIMSNSEKK